MAKTETKANPLTHDEAKAEIQRLAKRVADLEYMEFDRTHEHAWEYARTITLTPKSPFAKEGKSTSWSWKCLDGYCRRSSPISTTFADTLPAHFPEDLR